MSENKHVPIEEMAFFRWYVEIADWAWEKVSRWPAFARDTVGKQLVRALDSIGANLVEGDGRYSLAEGLHFLIIARASAREARYWLQRALVRKLIPQKEADERIESLASATRLLNNLIAYRRRAKNTGLVREPEPTYDASPDDPFTAD